MMTTHTETTSDYFVLFNSHIEGAKLHHDEVRGLCPFHDDHTPSWTGNRYSGLWRCFGCGAQGNVRKFAERVGEDGEMENVHQQRKIVATYDYHDESGSLLFQVVRFSPKAFAQRKPDGHGGWTWNLNGTRRVLYRLPEILGVGTVFVVEGEKDVDRLWSLGLPATTCPQGAGKWRDEYSESLRDKRVVILPDNDEPGERHALQVARSLLPTAASIKVARLPGLPEKGDISDWLGTGRTREELVEIVENTPEMTTHEDLRSDKKKGVSEGVVVTKLSDVTSQKVKWLWPSRIPLGKVTVLDGDPGLGKSLLSLDIAARVSLSRVMPDGAESNLNGPAGVVLLSAEDDPVDTIRPRLEAAGADVSRIAMLSGLRDGDSIRLPSLSDLDAIKHAIAEVDAKLVIVDPLMAFLPGKVDAHQDQDIRRSLAPLAALAAETGVAILVIRHLNKSGSGKALYRGGGSIGIIGAARSGLLVAEDPEDQERRILAVTKSNLAKLPPALAYRIEAAVDAVPWLAWEGATDYTASSLLAQAGEGEEDRSALAEAQEFLRETLWDGHRSAKDVQREAVSVGISERTLKRARSILGVKAAKRGGRWTDGKCSWVWSLPCLEGGQEGTEGGQGLVFGPLQSSSEKNTRKFNDITEGGQVFENGPLQRADGPLQEPETREVF